MYTDRPTINKYTGQNLDASYDNFLNVAIKAVQDYIDSACSSSGGYRTFEKSDVETRKFDGNEGMDLEIDDLYSLTSLKVDGIALIENEDFFLYPANDTPKTKIQLCQDYQASGLNNSRMSVAGKSRYIFNRGQQNVEVTGKFYYDDEVPETIKLVATRLVAGLITGNSDVKKSESFDDYSVSYSDVEKLSNQLGINDLLAPYMRGVKIKIGILRV